MLDNFFSNILILNILYLIQPSTLVDGRTVCLPCGPKVKEMPAPGLSFGTKANTVLDAVAKGSVACSIWKSSIKDILL